VFEPLLTFHTWAQRQQNLHIGDVFGVTYKSRLGEASHKLARVIAYTIADPKKAFPDLVGNSLHLHQKRSCDSLPSFMAVSCLRLLGIRRKEAVY
jgi:hypothetical protein